MTCQYCGTQIGVTTLTGLKNNQTIVACGFCLQKAHYCDLCSKVVTASIEVAGKRVCGACTDQDFCRHCGKVTKALKNNACSTCYAKMRNCTVCKTRTMDYIVTEHDTNMCRACCAKEKLIHCPHCDKWHTAGNYDVNLGVCKTCAVDTRKCYICGVTGYKNSMAQFHEDAYICKKHVLVGVTCSCCGVPSVVVKHQLPGELQPAEPNPALCGKCIVEQKYGVIKKYAYKPNGKFHPDYHPTQLFLGVENEVNFEGVTRLSNCKILQDLDPQEEYYYIKRDGSIPNGFEIVTHPFTFEFFKENPILLDKLFTDLPEKYKHSNKCGMHIHMSKSAFTNAQLFRFMHFVHTNAKFITTIAERNPNGYCPEIKQEGMVDRAKMKAGGDRGQVNLNPDHTVEIRMFQGAITREQYCKNVEFVHALFLFSRTFLLRNLTVENFCEFVQKTPHLYQNLIQFLVKKKVI